MEMDKQEDYDLRGIHIYSVPLKIIILTFGEPSRILPEWKMSFLVSSFHQYSVKHTSEGTFLQHFLFCMNNLAKYLHYSSLIGKACMDRPGERQCM